MARTAVKALPYEHVLVRREGRVGLVQINRPKAMNALSTPLMAELVQALRELDLDDAIGAMVVTGDERAFAAGADIKEMAGVTPMELLTRGSLDLWDAVGRLAKPVIAAVSGFCFGGGCELAMLCDMIVASETARFGQPEIAIGVIPGAGGTQRLTRILGKARAMELVLTGESIGAREALAYGLVNRVVPVELYLEEALKLAAKIAGQPPLAVKMAKEAINAVDQMHLDEGLQVERKNFYLLFSSEDQKEGMAAFVQKRAPNWKGK
ncbi:MAG: fadB [Cyanobacteria bacterium RYN_339]|nr:fadB [Cyanobacteria bacterium RYN_339]